MTTTPDALALAAECALGVTYLGRSGPVDESHAADRLKRAAAALRDLAAAEKERDRLAARVQELEATLRALPWADERGQGQPWQDAMDRARAAAALRDLAAAALVAAGLRIVRVLVRRDGTREYITDAAQERDAAVAERDRLEKRVAQLEAMQLQLDGTACIRFASGVRIQSDPEMPGGILVTAIPEREAAEIAALGEGGE